MVETSNGDNGMNEKVPYEQYVAWLKDGTLLSQPLQIGFRQYVRENKNVPDNIKDLLCGEAGAGGLLGQ